MLVAFAGLFLKLKRNSYGKQIDKPSKENLLLTKTISKV